MTARCDAQEGQGTEGLGFASADASGEPVLEAGSLELRAGPPLELVGHAASEIEKEINVFVTKYQKRTVPYFSIP